LFLLLKNELPQIHVKKSWICHSIATKKTVKAMSLIRSQFSLWFFRSFFEDKKTYQFFYYIVFISIGAWKQKLHYPKPKMVFVRHCKKITKSQNNFFDILILIENIFAYIKRIDSFYLDYWWESYEQSFFRCNLSKKNLIIGSIF